MHAMVTARVPVEIKNRGDRKLKEIGATATELINSAYEYVIEHGEIPGRVKQEKASEPVVKILDGTAASEFRNRWRSRETLDFPRYDGSNFQELLDEARGNRHARFA